MNHLLGSHVRRCRQIMHAGDGAFLHDAFPFEGVVASPRLACQSRPGRSGPRRLGGSRGRILARLVDERGTPAADSAENKTTGPQPDTSPANPFARALVAAVEPNARKEARKSLDRRQAVDTTSTAPSGKPGRKTAGGLTKDKSFGHETSGGRT